MPIPVGALDAEPVSAVAVGYDELAQEIRSSVRLNTQLSGDGSAPSPAGQ